MEKAVEFTVSDRQRAILEKWIRNKAATTQRLFERCQIILMCAKGTSNSEQGRSLGVVRQRPRRLRKRWAANQERLAAAERKGASDKDLAKLVADILADAPRAGVNESASSTRLGALPGSTRSRSGSAFSHAAP